MHQRPIIPGRAHLVEAQADLRLYRTLLALLPWTVHHDHKAERVAARIPAQRGPVDVEPARRSVPSGLPRRPGPQWGRPR